MEIFFDRLLDKLGFDVCSKPHVQGLMHWFSCVPSMDFEYVLDVIFNGNPCKYWTPKGKVCPTLSAQCYGNYCNRSPVVASPEEDQSPVVVQPETDAPTEAPPSPVTDAPTDAPTAPPTAAPTNAPTNAPTVAPPTA